MGPAGSVSVSVPVVRCLWSVPGISLLSTEAETGTETETEYRNGSQKPVRLTETGTAHRNRHRNRKEHPAPLDFSVGYHWGKPSNLLIALKTTVPGTEVK